jgi:hypothetical protein
VAAVPLPGGGHFDLNVQKVLDYETRAGDENRTRVLSLGSALEAILANLENGKRPVERPYLLTGSDRH